MPELREKTFALRRQGSRLSVQHVPEVDPILGPEMRSTGEVLGPSNFGEAFFKAQEATQTVLPLSGTVLITVNNRDKEEEPSTSPRVRARRLLHHRHGRHGRDAREHGIVCDTINKQGEGRPDILDAITNGEIDFVINTPSSAGKAPSTTATSARQPSRPTCPT